MDRSAYGVFESYMLECMEDSAHDKSHIYRVLFAALDIAEQERDVDMDILVAACLLHDIGRAKQAQDPSLCHAEEGAGMAHAFCLEQGLPAAEPAHIRDCIASHRFRVDIPPVTIEAKILFDADKLDSSGLIGIARTLVYGGEQEEPLYTIDERGMVRDDTGGHSFFREYHRKLERIYGTFHTARGKALAQQRQQDAVAFYQGLLAEVDTLHRQGQGRLEAILQSEKE